MSSFGGQENTSLKTGMIISTSGICSTSLCFVIQNPLMMLLFFSHAVFLSITQNCSCWQYNGNGESYTRDNLHYAPPSVL